MADNNSHSTGFNTDEFLSDTEMKKLVDYFKWYFHHPFAKDLLACEETNS
jgi:hypothetical protein